MQAAAASPALGQEKEQRKNQEKTDSCSTSGHLKIFTPHAFKTIC